MEVQHILVALVLGLIVVLGVSAALYMVSGDTGSGINDTSNSLGDQLDCVLSNKEQAQEKCDEAGTQGTSLQNHGSSSYEA